MGHSDTEAHDEGPGEEGAPPSPPDDDVDLNAPIDDVDIFAGVYGHSGCKQILASALRKGGVHILMIGPPGCGKSTLMMALEKNLPPDAVEYRDGKSITAYQLTSVLAEDPPILLIDEFDELSQDAYSALSTPMEHGRVVRDSGNETIDKEIDTQIIASCNDPAPIPQNIRSRLQALEFEQYDEEEYLEVCERMLVGEIDWIETPTQAREMGKIAYQITEGSTDPRDARDIAKLSDSFAEAKKVGKALNDPDADLGDISLHPTEIKAASEQVSRERVAQIAVQDVATGEVEEGTAPEDPVDEERGTTSEPVEEERDEEIEEQVAQEIEAEIEEQLPN